MSTSQESTSFVDEAEPLPESNPTESSLDRKVGMAQKFDKEMKDYAKATVKEFLGIYGYEEDVDINIDDSGEGVGPRSETNTNSDTQSESSNSNQQTSQAEARIMASTKTSSCSVEKRTSESPVTSVHISSSTSNGNPDMTRFCITMSIPRNGADSEQGYTTLRFWNCIMCSTAFVGCKPEIVQRIHHPHLFTFQPEWLSHAGICTRCQNTLTMSAPKITIYAINEAPQYHHSYTGPPATVPVVGRTCNAQPGYCNCAGGTHGHVPGVVPMNYTGTNPRGSTLGSNVPTINIKTEAVSASAVVGLTPQAPLRVKKPNYAFRPITCTQ